MLVQVLVGFVQIAAQIPSSAPSAPALSTAAVCSTNWIPTFGPHNALDDLVNAMQVFDDGTGPALYVGGKFQTSGSLELRGVAKWNGAGFTPLGVGPANYSLEDVRTLTVYDDGGGAALYAAGNFSSGGGLTRWDGTAWVPVGGGLSLSNPSYPGETAWLHTSEVHDAGAGPELYVVGFFTLAGGVPASGWAKWNGSSWTAITGSPGGANDLVEYDDGGGKRLYSAGNGVWRLGPGGWTSVSTGAGTVTRLCVFDPGTGPELYAAGTFGGSTDVARWNGTNWDRLFSLLQTVNALGVFDDGSGARLYAQGTSGTTGRLRYFDGAAWQEEPGALTHPSGNAGVAFALQQFDDGSGNRLFVGGGFGRVGATSAGNFARFDGSAWQGGATGLNELVYALARHDDGSGDKLYVGGGFTAIDGLTRRSIARWDGANWSSAGAGFASGRVNALMTFDPGTGRALYAGGSFHVAGGDNGNRIARWTGTSWAPLGTGLTGGANTDVRALCEYDDGTGNALYVGGRFTTAGSVATSCIAKWDGSSWSSVGGGVAAGVSTRVEDLAVFDDGTGPKLYVAGSFATAGGNSIEGIARWNGTSFSAVTPGATFGVVSALAGYDDGSGMQLYAAGTFSQIAGFTTDCIARWNGTAWSAVGAAGPFSRFETLRVFDDGTGAGLYAGGNHLPGGSTIARWDGAWSPIAPGTGVSGSYTFALAEFDDGTIRALYAGGVFTNNPSGDKNLARYGCTSSVASFCAGDGSGTACPCGNSGAPGNGCASSISSFGANLDWSGSTSVAAEDFRLLGTDMPNASCLYFQGTAPQAGGAGVVFGDGLRCIGGTVQRLGIKTNVAGASSYPGSGELSIVDRGAIPPGGGVTRWYQCWYRNSAAFCSASTFNLTNGLAVEWGG